MAESRRTFFNDDTYWVDRYDPGDLLTSGDNALGRPFTPAALHIATGIRDVCRRTTERPVGAETVARELSRRPGTFYVAHRSDAVEPVAYAYVVPTETRHRHIGYGVLQIIDLEALNANEGIDACREAGAITLAAIIIDAPEQTVTVDISRRNFIADGKLVEEGRSVEFFSGLKMHLRGAEAWGKDDSRMVGEIGEVRAAIWANYEVDWPGSRGTAISALS